MPKKQARNAFYFYMKELEPALRREGRVFPNGMADVVEIAHPRWKALPQKEKERFENMSKNHKRMMRGKEGDKIRLDNLGNVLANRKDPLTEYEKRRMQEKKDMRKDWPPGKAIAREKFYVINFQTMCKTLDGVYLPCEMAIIEYSIEKGIMRKMHKFVNPGTIPKGYMFTCRQTSEDTHQIPVEDFELSDSNYRGMWIQLENFINPQGVKSENPIIYTLGAKDNWEVTECCLDWVHGHACLGEPNRIRKIYELESLFQELHAHVGNDVSKTRCIETLTSSDWDYEPNTRCDYHEEKEVKDCSLGIINRHLYAMSDSLCEYYNIQLTKNHLPMRKDVQSFNVLPPTSMQLSSRSGGVRGSPQRNNRPPQQQQPQRQQQQQQQQPARRQPDEDYESMRQPRVPVPVASGSGGAWGATGGAAWGGGATGGGAPMGRGAFQSSNADFPPMGRGAYQSNSGDFPPMGRGATQTDFFPMGRGGNQPAASRGPPPMGRGLVAGMQGMTVDPGAYSGRAVPPQPSEAPPIPTAWQQSGVGRGVVQPGPAPPGIGRGFVPPPPAHPSQFQDVDHEDMLPLRMPGQMAPSHMAGGHPQQFHDAGGEPAYFPEDVDEVCREGRGRGGILRNLMMHGVRQGVPQGRGNVPFDWVDDGSMGPLLK